MIQRATAESFPTFNLTDKGRALLELLSDVMDTRTKREKALQIGLTPEYASTLSRKPEFIAMQRARTDQILASTRTDIYSALVRQAHAGDVQAIRTYLQAIGDIQNGVNVTTNVTQTNAADALTERLERHHEARFKRIPSDT